MAGPFLGRPPFRGARSVYGPHNLLLYSEQIDNAAFTKLNGTVTQDAAAAPNGTISAERFTENGATGEHAINIAIASVATVRYTASVYAKAETRAWARLSFANLGNSNVYFNLGTGEIGTRQFAVADAVVVPLADGWFRIVATWTATSAFNYMTFGPTTGNGTATYAGDGSSTMLFWGAQLNIGPVATGYVQTTTGASV